MHPSKRKLPKGSKRAEYTNRGMSTRLAGNASTAESCLSGVIYGVAVFGKGAVG